MQKAHAQDFLSEPLTEYRNAMDEGRHKDAVVHADTMIAAQPEEAALFACRAEANFRDGLFIDACNDFAQAHTLSPSEPQYLFRFGDALVRAGDRDSAESCFARALELDPLHLNSLLAMGEVQEMSGKTREAAKYFLKAVEHHEESARACHSAGRFLHLYGDRVTASQFFAQAIKNDPSLPEPYRVLANYLRDAHNMGDAIKVYEALLDVAPDDAIGRAELAHCLALTNAWENPHYKDFDPAAPEQLDVAAGPWMYLSMEDNPERLLQRCRNYASRVLANISQDEVVPRRNEKLRIGYFSADFHDHATMHLIAGVLEAHDKEKFEIYAYSFGPDKTDHMRDRAMAAVDHFEDISAVSDYAVAEIARGHELDIAIDLKGFTANTRMGIFGHRVAPVQVTWLGFPGSTGADCMDYLIADDMVIPDDAECYYSENVLRLPGCYQPNDRARPLPDPNLARADMGLPEDGVVFASFNNVYKVSPAEFDIWMQLLEEVEGSVLWQLVGGKDSTQNLRMAAARRGIDPERIIIAPRVGQAEHLARLGLADIFLDTFNCNAHTTASDALWAGVPVVTSPGQQFAARVAASLVQAAGTPETICADRASYKDKALQLAQDTETRERIRAKLIASRETSTLFDTLAFTRNLENALASIAKTG